jgi:cysteine synthase B
MRVGSVLELVGSTPMVDVSALSPRDSVRIWLKLEGANPTGSVKDRVALALVERAESDGLLVPGKPDQVLLEPTSGNTGIALAIVCRLRGYHLKVVLPDNVSPERRQLLAAYGAEVIESAGAEGSNGAVRLARRLAVEHPEWVFLYQYANPANPDVHRRTTGPEILADCPEVTHFVAGLGTTGTLVGVGSFLKAHRAAIQVWAVEPPAGEAVDGLRSLEDGYVPPVFVDGGGEAILDRRVVVRPRDSVEWTRRLASLGLLVGLSTGAAMAGAHRCASGLADGEEAAIVVLSADDGWKYLSSDAWGGDLDEVAERASRTTYF